MKGARFDYFVILADMRTGSNFLEANLNALNGVTCHGEAFNPQFIGYPNREKLFQMSQAERDADPHVLLDRIREGDGTFCGFRYFRDHDPRVLDRLLDDPRCAKIMLTRNPLESFVSLKIAQATDQWKLTRVEKRKQAKIRFESAEFASYLSSLQAFQNMVMGRLQRLGQTAFFVGYEDLRDVDVINGVAQFLGLDARLTGLDGTLKVQNPGSPLDKVTNPSEMSRALAKMDWFALSHVPVFEPRRGPAVPTYVTAAQAPVLYLPIPGSAHDDVLGWMAALDDVAQEDLPTGLTRKDLRAWRMSHKPHRSFTVVRHPLSRAHSVYCRRVVAKGPGAFAGIRAALIKGFDLEMPEDGAGPDWDIDAHRAGFVSFLRFVKANLNSQTPQRVDPEWTSQVQILDGFSRVISPDLILRDTSLQAEMDSLSTLLETPIVPVKPKPKDTPFELADIYDNALESHAKAAYPRDYLAFGFGDWA